MKQPSAQRKEKKRGPGKTKSQAAKKVRLNGDEEQVSGSSREQNVGKGKVGNLVHCCGEREGISGSMVGWEEKFKRQRETGKKGGVQFEDTKK